jgi:hypothetical protein
MRGSKLDITSPFLLDGGRVGDGGVSRGVGAKASFGA